MAKSLLRLFGRSSVNTVLSAAVNIVSTLFIVRFLGGEVYADQIVDLAKLALLLVVVDLIPSNFIVFKMQDEPIWKDALVANTIAAGLFVFILLLAVLNVTSIFNTNNWILSIYALSLIIKRHNDIILQSSGMIDRLFLLDVINSILRFSFVLLLFAIQLDNDTIVWFSLGLAGIISQGIGIKWVSNYGGSLAGAASLKWWPYLRSNIGNLVGYYPTIGFKRLADSLAPLLADWFFASKDHLVVFLLAFRSLSFTSVFSRVFEAILNNRAHLKLVTNNTKRYVVLLAAMSHLAAFVISIILIYLSGLSDINYIFLALLSSIAWPLVFYSVGRAQKYSEYRVFQVAVSYLVYIFLFLFLVGLSYFTGLSGLVVFGVCMVTAKFVQYLSLKVNIN